MAKDNPTDGRLIESIFYGTPVYGHITTPDGRVLTEVHKGRLDDARRHEQTTALQGEIVTALKQVHGGQTMVARDAFLGRSSEVAQALGQVSGAFQDMRGGQREMLESNRLLANISGQGFDAVNNTLRGVEAGLSGVGSTLTTMEGIARSTDSKIAAGNRSLVNIDSSADKLRWETRSGLVDVNRNLYGANRTLSSIKGPVLDSKTLRDALVDEEIFFLTLGAYSKGLLNEAGVICLRNFINEKLRADKRLGDGSNPQVDTAAYMRSRIMEQYWSKLAEIGTNKFGLSFDMPKPPSGADMRDYILGENGRFFDRKTIVDFRDNRTNISRQIDATRDKMLKEMEEILEIISEPSEIIFNPHFIYKLRVLEGVQSMSKDENLLAFVQSAYALIKMYEQSKRSPMPQEFLVDLTNLDLLSSDLQHSIKTSDRRARLSGSMTDMNFNIMEGLGQGDYAIAQRERTNGLTERLLGHAEVGTMQRSEQLELMKHQLRVNVGVSRILNTVAEVGVRSEKHLGGIAKSSAESNRHLTGLVEIGTESRRELSRIATLQERSGMSLEEIRDIVHVSEGHLERSEGHLANIDRLVSNSGMTIEDIRSILTSSDSRLQSIENVQLRSESHLRGMLGTMGFIAQEMINLEEMGERIVEVMQGGFAETVGAIDEVRSSIDSFRVESMQHLSTINESVKAVVMAVYIANTNLEKIVHLTEESLKNTALQRLRQGFLLLEHAENKDDFEGAIAVFKKALEDDPTVVENQLGMAIASEGLGDIVEAKKRYRNVGKITPEEKNELASTGWQNLARINISENELPNAIQNGKLALERNPKNLEARLTLCRTLALSGMEEEAVEQMYIVYTMTMSYLSQFKVESVYTPTFLLKFYQKVLEMKKISNLNRNELDFLYNEFITLKEDKEASIVLKYLLRKNPRFVLKKYQDGMIISDEIKKSLMETINTMITERSDLHSSEDWYALSFLVLRISGDELLTFKLFTLGAKNNVNYQRKDKEKVLQQLGTIDQALLSKLIEIINEIDQSTIWIK